MESLEDSLKKERLVLKYVWAFYLGYPVRGIFFPDRKLIQYSMYVHVITSYFCMVEHSFGMIIPNDSAVFAVFASLAAFAFLLFL